MDKPKSDLDFRLRSFAYKFRDLFVPRMHILNEVGIKPGFHVLDYGCGPGSYLAPLAALVGDSGQIFALDLHPLALTRCQCIAARKHVKNLETIHSDCKTGLPDRSIGLVLLYDTFHALSEPESVLAELHRILKPEGMLSVSDHHMNASELLAQVTQSGLFRLSRKGKRTYSFSKENPRQSLIALRR